MNNTTVYLRPISYINPRQIRLAAIWLVNNKQFNNIQNAEEWLMKISYDDLPRFRSIMSGYFSYEIEKNKIPYVKSINDVNDVEKYRSVDNNYGEESHMWY